MGFSISFPLFYISLQAKCTVVSCGLRIGARSWMDVEYGAFLGSSLGSVRCD